MRSNKTGIDFRVKHAGIDYDITLLKKAGGKKKHVFKLVT